MSAPVIAYATDEDVALFALKSPSVPAASTWSRGQSLAKSDGAKRATSSSVA